MRKQYPQHTVVVDDDLWSAALAKAAAFGLSLSAVIRLLLKMWVRGDVELRE